MCLFKILSNNFCKHNFHLYTSLFLLQWSTFYILSSVGEANFGNSTYSSKEALQHIKFIKIIPLKFQHTTRSFKHLLPITVKRNEQRNSMQKSLYFLYYKNGKMLSANSPGIEPINQSYQYVIKSCVNEKISFIFHGWSESCNTEWVPHLQERLTFHRGGCIICVDYSSWSKKSYIELLLKFDVISEILYEEILKLIKIGWNPSKIFMFGFSYGGQIASKIGRQLRPLYNISKIDVCDMAGPGFDFLTNLNHSEAAENVQCYYSSIDKGSHFYSCHQNIRLGQCGYTQPAILSQPYLGSHGLCVRIYINAFDFPFYALQETSLRHNESGKPTNNLPYDLTVGYREFGYKNIRGDIFVPTSLNYPYNLSKKEINSYGKYLLEGCINKSLFFNIINL